MSAPFFFYPNLGAASDTATLTGDEAQHAAGARRLRVGEQLVLFDGKGLMAQATLRTLHDRGRELELEIGARQRQPPPAPPIHLASALPKGDRLATLLDMATQLGITSFTPLMCERSVVEPTASNLERMRRVCLEACKQSRRAWLPLLREPISPSLAAAEATSSGSVALIAHPGGTRFSEIALNPERPRHVFIGPEGGFSAKEINELNAAGGHTVALGEGILRIETAAVAMVTFARGL